MTTEHWNERYGDAAYHYGTAANVWLASQGWRLPRAGDALAIADGEGRNGVWLAEQGLATTSLDQSAKGLDKARALAQQRGVTLATLQVDLAHFEWPHAAYDVMASIYVHLPVPLRVRTHAGCAQALRPGGLLILEAFTPEQMQCHSGGPRDPALLYTPELLRGDLAGLDILELLSGEVLLAEGRGHAGPGRVVRLLAQRRR